MATKDHSRVRLTDQFVMIGFGLAAVYWIIDSVLYIFLSYDIDFFQQLLGLNLNEVWTRLIVCCLFVIFGSHAQYTINNRKMAEEALQKSEERYRTIIESIEDGYFEVDISGNFFFFNDSMIEIIGYPRQEAMGMNARQIMDEENAQKLFQTFDNVRLSGKATKVLDLTFIKKDGSERFVETSVSLIRGSSDQPTGFRGISRDITRRKQTEALQQAKAAAEAASLSKSEFLANMSHEIRTPLNSIIGLVELMLGTDLSTDQREDLEVVISSAYALLAVINDILDFSKIEVGKLELEKTDFNLRDVLGDVLKIMAIKTHEKGLELAYRVAPDVPDRLIGDPSRFNQVILNLVGNAVKFTDEGEIVVFVEQEQQTDTETYLRFSVKDTGIGILEDRQETIFYAFEQADGSTSRRFGGTGLGLAVSSQLVELMGGRIWVESKEGQGSTFHFTAHFTMQPDEKKMHELLPDIDLSGMRVLVVDDNATNRQIIQEILESWRMFPVVASGIDEAQRYFVQKQQSGVPFELVLIDSQMPESDGFSLARWVNDQETPGCNVIMMLTHSSFRNRVDLEQIGVKANVTKPIRPSDLLTAIMVALGVEKLKPEPSSKPADQEPGDGGRSLRILVAEDTPFNQKFITRLLTRWGHNAVIVENGREALEVFSNDKFDLVLMDVQMPEMDGFEATAAIRDLEKQTGRHIPIIAMTAHAMKGDRERCLEAGMDEYVSKPISSDTFFKAIHTLVPVEAQDVPEPETVGSAFDKDALLAAFDHDWDFFKEAVDMFVADYRPMMTAIQKALKTKDADTLKRTAHALKGMVGNFQGSVGARAAFNLEEMGRQGDFAGADQEYDRLTDELAELEKTLLNLVDEVKALDT